MRLFSGAPVSDSRRDASTTDFVKVAKQTRATRRVLHVITPSHFGGAEMQVLRLSGRMRDRGHHMPILLKQGSPVIAELRARGLDVDVARIGGKANLLAIPVLARAARRHQAQLLHTHLSTASWWCGWLESLGGTPSVGHVHGFTSAAWHSRQSHLIAVSGAVRADLLRQGISPARITVVHNPVEPDEFRPARNPLSIRAEFGADARTPVVGSFAHLSVKKGYRDLFDAMPQIVAAAPTVQLWVMGRGPLEAELKETARSRGFVERVRFAGFRRDAADVMNAIDVLAMPSHREPFGLVYVEAALLGKPVVACRSGGAVEAVAEGETGLLVPPGDSGAIAGAILALLENVEFARRMGSAGRDRARELFSWPPCLAAIETIYDRVLART